MGSARVKDGFVSSSICECGGPKYRYSHRCRRCIGSSMRGRNRPDLLPFDEPDAIEIAWAAGFYEGEGSVSHQRGGLRVSAFQNEQQPLLRLRRYFGGSVRPSQRGNLWYASGRLAEQFMETVKVHLSDRRLRQYSSAVEAMVAHRAC